MGLGILKKKRTGNNDTIKNHSNENSINDGDSKTICYIGRHYDNIKEVNGPDIHFYYIYKELQRMGKVRAFTRSFLKNIATYKKSKYVWIEYPCGRYPAILILLFSLVQKKKIALNIRDLPVEQAKSLHPKRRKPFFDFQVKALETLLVKKSNFISVFSPGFINLIKPSTKDVYIFSPGISKNLLRKKDLNYQKPVRDKNILLYAGSLDRGGMIYKLTSIFSEIDGWELWIAGQGSEIIDNNNNVKYLGILHYNEIQELYNTVDALVIPYPRGGYFDICIPLKTTEALASCKPIISSRLPFMVKYICEIGLEQNMIYTEEWTKTDIENALKDVSNHSISTEYTYKMLQKRTWEERTRSLINDAFLILSANDKNTSK